MYAYSPHTGELINTDNPASWMQTTPIAPPMFNASTEGCFFQNGAWVVVVQSGKSLEETKADKIIEINNSCQHDLAMIVNPYPTQETLTWPNQYNEAQAFTTNNSTPTPMLTAISLTSGLTVAALAESVLLKAAAYNNLSGAAVGKRQKLTAQVIAATTIDEVHAITW